MTDTPASPVTVRANGPHVVLDLTGEGAGVVLDVDQVHDLIEALQAAAREARHRDD